ncbi:phosphatase PAP2 family protein [Arsenicicoccus dermatophilus]|uniref:phosphatase PAP2 family protein n=1 Tax=Arsenicicoccus dermatophilus TaxID=1076331 RepID=UPI003891FF33
MGLSRVFLGHHWSTDVVSGGLLGLAWVLVLVVCHRPWLTLVRHHSPRREQ